MSIDLHDKDVASEFYDKRYETGYMEEWDDLKKNKVREVLLLLNLPSKGKALDFGCGNGVFTNIIKEVLPSWEVYGVDISKIAVRNARLKFPNCNFFDTDESVNHKNFFDFLFSHHVIEHIQDVEETFSEINSYLRPNSFQLHILPCGNVGSFEYEICKLKTDGIEADKENRFFFEEPGHLRRLNTEEFVRYERKYNFELKKDFYSNQYWGAINWITKSSPRFVKMLTSTENALDVAAAIKLKSLRKKLLPLTYFQFSYSKYIEIKNKWHKNVADYLKMIVLFIPAVLVKSKFISLQKKAHEEWINNKTQKNGSEMFLFFAR